MYRQKKPKRPVHMFIIYIGLSKSVLIVESIVLYQRNFCKPNFNLKIQFHWRIVKLSATILNDIPQMVFCSQDTFVDVC